MNSRPAQQAFFGWKNIGLLFGVYLLGMGVVYYGFNVIFPEMVKTMGWSRGDASWAQTLRGLLVGFAAPVVAIALNKFGARLTMCVGLLILTAGCLLLATVTTELWHWTVIWGVVMAIGFAFGGVIPVQTTVTHWFDARRATALGLVMTAAGVGGFIAQPLHAWIIELYGNWQTSWFVGTGFALAATLLSLRLVNKPEDIGQYADGIDPEEAADMASKTPAKTHKTKDAWTLKHAIRTPTLWFIIVLFLAQIMPLYLLMVHGVLHLTDLNYGRMEAASVLSFMVAGSAFARFPIGWLGDRIEPRHIVVALNLCSVAALSVIWKAPDITWLLLMSPLFGVAYGGAIVMLPTMIANYYGRASFASINGFMYPVQIIFGALVPVGAGYAADITGNYDWPFFVIIVFVAASILCALAATPPKSIARLP